MGYTTRWDRAQMINSTFIIGITGNIATGKSVIRRMLANAGILGIDADVLAHRMFYPGGPAYQTVIEAFGSEIKSDHDSISNKKLGQIVFNDPERLRQLESLVHPPVINAIIKRVKAAHRPLIAVEAIKLLESGLGSYCDSIWVSYASFDHQIQRLVSQRGLSHEEASSRIKAQPPQSAKFSQADVIINTETSFKDTWLRTQSALNDTIQPSKMDSPLHINSTEDGSVVLVNSFPVSQLESAWDEMAGEGSATLFEHLGMRMVFPILKEDHILAFVMWENWNFTATLKKIYPSSFVKKKPGLVFDSFIKHAMMNQAEILLVTSELINEVGIQPASLGFTQQHIDRLTYPAWRIAAQKAASRNESTLWVKVLTQPFELEDDTKFL